MVDKKIETPYNIYISLSEVLKGEYPSAVLQMRCKPKR